MRLLWDRLAKSTNGNATIFFAAALPVLIAAMCLGLDASFAYVARERLQQAADEGALAAARAYVSNSSANLTSEVQFIAGKYNFTTATNATITVNRPPASGALSGNTKAIEVIISQQQPQFFSTIFTSRAITVSGRAVARSGQSLCMMALNSSASGAINVSGNIQVNLQNCALQDNSSSSKALAASGGASITAQSVNVVGQINASGGSTITTTGGTTQNGSAMTDPFASVALPTYSGCDSTNYSTSGVATLNPGVYCGGMTFNSGANVTLNPGTYIVDQGAFTVSGGGIVQGSGVTIILTSHTGSNYGGLAISGSAQVTLSGPTSGTLAGLVFFGDRTMPTSTKFTFSGGSNQTITGAIYLPRGQVIYSGGTTLNSNCTSIIGDTINISGSSTLSGQCTAFGSSAVNGSISLVE